MEMNLFKPKPNDSMGIPAMKKARKFATESNKFPHSISSVNYLAKKNNTKTEKTKIDFCKIGSKKKSFEWQAEISASSLEIADLYCFRAQNRFI